MTQTDEPKGELEPKDWAGVHSVINRFSTRIVKIVLVLVFSIGFDLILSGGLAVAYIKTTQTANENKKILKEFKAQEIRRQVERCEDDNTASQRQHDLWDPIIANALNNSTSDEQLNSAYKFKNSIDTAYFVRNCTQLEKELRSDPH